MFINNKYLFIFKFIQLISHLISIIMYSICFFPFRRLEMFRLLGLPRGTSLEKLTFGQLLGAQPKVMANLEKLKELNARAHGEVSIREAIQELEMWAAQAEFTMTEYK
jgi:hypothetical protein